MKESTVTAQSMHPPSFGLPIDPYSIRDEVINPKPERTASQPTIPCASYPSQPVYYELEAPAPGAIRMADAVPALMLNRPRSLFNNRTMTAPTLHSRDANGNINSSRSTANWTNRTTAGMPAQWRPEYMYQRPIPIRTKSSRRAVLQPNELFSKLPAEILSLILQQLQNLHLGYKSTSCATCWMRDACSLCVTCSRWHKPAREAL